MGEFKETEQKILSQEIVKKKELLQKHSFEFMFQMIFIIGAPALLATYFGKKIGIEKNVYPQLMIVFMIVALIFSWLIIFVKYKKFNQEIKEIDKEEKEYKKQI